MGKKPTGKISENYTFLFGGYIHTKKVLFDIKMREFDLIFSVKLVSGGGI